MLIFDNLKKDFNKNLEFQFYLDNITNNKFYLSYLANSNDRHLFNITIKDTSDNLIYTNDILTFYTESYDDEHAKQLIDIDKVFELNINTNYVVSINSIEDKKIPTIYQIYLNSYDEKLVISDDKFINKYKRDPMKIKFFFPLKVNKFLIISNVSARYGGFWWCVMQAIHGMKLAEQYGLIPIIDYQGGLYYSNKIYDPKWVKEEKSWWNYFFEEPVFLDNKQKKLILDNPNKKEFFPLRRNRDRFTREAKPHIIPDIPDDNTFVYTFNSFSRFSNIRPWEHHQLANKFLKPLQYIKDYYNLFWNSIKEKFNIDDLNSIIIIGVHYRGTDKFSWGICDEGKPMHYKYEKVVDAINKKIIDDNLKNYLIYCSSDETPFIEHFKNSFPNKVFSHEHNIRSNISSSGENYDFNIIGKKDIISDEDKQIKIKWDYFKNHSIHFGMKDTSNFLKGFYSFLDCLLFDKCKYIFRSRGNFSDYCVYLNKNNCISIDLNNVAALS